MPAGDQAAAASPGAAAGTGTFVSLSDIHFDPFSDPALFARLMASEPSGWRAIFESSSVTTLAVAGADSNYDLLASALQAARSAAPDPDFVVVSGDFLAHGFQKSFETALTGLSSTPAIADCRAGGEPPLHCFIDRTIEFVATMLRDSFPDAPVYPALGNNDSYCGDYEIDPLGPFVEHTGATWSRLLIDESNRASFADTFADGGYYQVVPAGSAARLIVLNSNLFSSHYRDACAVSDVRAEPPPRSSAREETATAADEPTGVSGSRVADAQLAWLREQLDETSAAGGGALLLYHIPAGIDVYSTARHGDPTSVSGVVGFWSAPYTASFLELIYARSGTLRAILAGHTHMDQFLLAAGEGPRTTAFEHVTPAISPVFGNNPAFEIFAFDRASGALLDYSTHYLPIAGAPAGSPPSWQTEYRFSETYGTSAVSAETLADLWTRLEAAGAERSYFQRYFDVSAGDGATFDGDAWAAYWCGIGAITADDFVACHRRAVQASAAARR